MSTAASARAQRPQRRAAQSAPQSRRMPIRVQSAARPDHEILSEHSSDDCYSEHEPTDALKGAVAFPATAASRMQPGAWATLSAALAATRELIDREFRDAWTPPTLGATRLAARPDAARSPLGVRPSLQRRRRPLQAGPRGQGAATAPPTHTDPSFREIGCLPASLHARGRRRHRHRNNELGVTKASRGIRTPNEREGKPFCLFHRRRSHNTSECWELKRLCEDRPGQAGRGGQSGHENTYESQGDDNHHQHLAERHDPLRDKIPHRQRDRTCSTSRPQVTTQTTSRSSWTVEVVSTSSLSLSTTRCAYTR